MKDQIRTQLASSIVAVISQAALCKKIGGRRIAAFEIMVTTTSIAQLMRENKTYRIASDIQTGASHGMISMDAHLMSLYNRDLITADEALSKSQYPEAMRDKFEAGATLRRINTSLYSR